MRKKDGYFMPDLSELRTGSVVNSPLGKILRRCYQCSIPEVLTTPERGAASRLQEWMREPKALFRQTRYLKNRV